MKRDETSLRQKLHHNVQNAGHNWKSHDQNYNFSAEQNFVAQALVAGVIAKACCELGEISHANDFENDGIEFVTVEKILSIKKDF